MNRREWLAGAGSLGIAACASAPARTADPLAGAALMADVRTYVGFGAHRSGSPGDVATTAWFARRWRALGYDIEHMPLEAPNADTTRAELVFADQTIAGIAQPPLGFTPKGGLRFGLARWVEGARSEVNTRIAVVDLPRGANGLLPFAAYRTAVEAAAKAGAVAVVAVMDTPSGEPAYNNTPIDMKPGIPVLMLPARFRDRLQQAGRLNEVAELYIEGPGGVRTARNTIARAGKSGPWLIVSTPQSGWFRCGGERGPGIAMSLALAAWAMRQGFQNRLLFVTTSGHEWTDAGAHLFHMHAAPTPDEPALWVHLGASFAARDFQQAPAGLKPLETPNQARTFMVSADMMADARAAYAGLAGLSEPTPASIPASAGELTLVLKEGYRSSAGFFGQNPHFHTMLDVADMTTPAIMEPIARATAAMIKARLQRS